MKNTFPSIFTKMVLIAAAASRVQAQSLAQPANPPAAPADLVNAFHAAFGDHHARAVHTKGIILEGSFIPDEQAATLTKASHLQKEPSLVTPRFSDITGLPEIPDNISVASPRGLAIKFIVPGGANTDVVCRSFNGLPRVMSSAQMFAGIKLFPSSPQASTINGQPLAMVNADVCFGTSMDEGY